MPEFSQASDAAIAWLLWLAKQPDGILILGAILCGVLLLFVLALHALEVSDPKVLTGGPTTTLPIVSTRTVRPRGPVYIPLELGNVTIDLQPSQTETLHVLIGGCTRTGKSTSVLPLFDLPIGVLTIALDSTVPIEAKIRSVGGIVWTNDPDKCSIGLNILSGPAMIAAEGLVAGFPKAENNVGDYQRTAAGVIWSALEQSDRDGVERNIPDVILALLRPLPDAEAGRACRSWARKLAALYRILGPTLGNDLDVAQAMRAGQKVLLKLNHFLSPDDAPFIAGMLLVLARRVMEQARVPFVLIIEEAGQAAMAQKHLAPIAQAGAARGVCALALTQNMSKLPIEVANNFSVTVSFAQEAHLEQRVAAERLDLASVQLRREAFPDKGVGWCYVRAPGIPTTLVHVKQQKPARVNLPVLLPSVAGPFAGSARRTVDATWASVEANALDGWTPYPLALPDGTKTGHFEAMPDCIAEDIDLARIWNSVNKRGQQNVWRTDVPCPLWEPTRGLWWDDRGCLEWRGLANAEGRGRSTRGLRADGRGRDCTVYREFFHAAFGYYPDPSFDHWCGNPRCVDWTHGGACSIPDNNARRSLREAAFKVAWAADQGRRVTA